jgi:hypothetical protein
LVAEEPELEETLADDDIGALREAIRAITHVDPTDRWVEVVAASVLALATIASAWSAYQATRWGGVQAAAFAEAGALRAESVRASDLADAELTVDVEYFAIWLDGASQGEEDLQQRVEDSFRPEFAVAFDAWQATDPFVNPDAPHTPFEMEEYSVAAAQDTDALRSEAERAAGEALDANQTGDNYVLTTVLFASVLFFAGISTKFQGRRIKLALVVLGLAAFIAGASILLTFPVH